MEKRGKASTAVKGMASLHEWMAQNKSKLVAFQLSTETISSQQVTNVRNGTPFGSEWPLLGRLPHGATSLAVLTRIQKDNRHVVGLVQHNTTFGGGFKGTPDSLAEWMAQKKSRLYIYH